MSLNYIIIAIKIGTLLFAAGYAFTYLLSTRDRLYFQQRAIWVMPGLLAVALITPFLPLFLFMLVLLLPVISRTRGEAAGLFIIASAGLPDLPFTLTAGGATLFTIGNFHALGFSLLAASYICRGGGRVRWGWRDLPMAIFVVLNIIAVVRGLNPTSVLRETIVVLMTFVVPYVALRRSVTNIADARFMMMAICFAAGVQSILAVYEMRAMWPVYNSLPEHFGIPENFSRALKIRGGLMRTHGAFPESTSFGWFLAIAFTLTIAVRRNFASRGYWAIALGIIALGLFASGARVGWLALGIGFVAIDYFRRRYGVMMRSLAIAAVGYAGLYVVAITTGLFGGIVGLTDDGGGTLEYRKLLFSRGMEEFYRYPLTGRSSTDVQFALSDLRQGEGIVDFVNSYIYYALTTGIFGVIAFLAMFLIALRAALSARVRPPLPDDAPAMQLAAAAFAVSAFSLVTAFTSGFGGSISLFYFALLAGVAQAPAMIRNARTRAAPPPRRPLIAIDLGRPSAG